MTISLKDIDEGAVVTVDETEFFDVPASYGLTKDAVSCDVRGALTRRGDSYDFKGSIEAVLPLRCARCLRDTSAAFSLDVSERFKKDADDELLRFENDTVDLKPIMIAILLLNIPMKTLCEDECKGLCGKCGFNLNEGEHDCDGAEIDPRFAALKPFISSD
jgi:uncharacterized protein